MHKAPLIFLNRVYWPDEAATAQLLTDLAEGLAARGWPVTIIASRSAGAPAEETRAGVSILRVAPARDTRRSLRARLLDDLSFHIGAVRCLRRLARPGATVVVMTDPPMLGFTAWLAVRGRGARLINWIQDVYPEIAQALAPFAALRFLLGGLRPLRNVAWRRSARCVVLGRDMAELVEQAGVRRQSIATIPNWAPAGLGPADGAALRAAWNLQDKFVIAYSGNLGRVHALDNVLELALSLREHREIVFVFIGGGAQRERLAAAAHTHDLPNVRFFPAQPRRQLAATLAVGDVHLITLRPGCEACVFPSKFYGIAAAGRPILFLGPLDCELSELVREQGLGAICAPADTALAHSTIVNWANDGDTLAACRSAALRFAARHGGSAAALEAWETLLR
ncbi:MAG TPA: glycosyltransferase family 4 protein [Opitutaceae bacterium]